VIAPALVLTAASLGPVVLRGAAEPDERAVVSIGVRGVEVSASDDSPTVLLGWERVKLVLGDGAERAKAFMPIADAAWRAEVRLLRGDIALAEPLLEELTEQLQGVESPTALLAYAGLARVRLDSTDIDGAIEAWRIAHALCTKGIRLNAELADVLRLDHETGLIVDLPIFWAGDAAILPTSDPLLGPIGRALDANDPSLRAAGRAELRGVLPGVEGSWREAWCRAAIGRSYLLETDPMQRDLGVLELLHLPARFSDDQPMLTSLALGAVLAELRTRGDSAEATIIEGQLRALDPNHPGLRLSKGAQP
jgi:hypothetical protein